MKQQWSLGRPRRTKKAMETFRAALAAIVKADPPMTCRQVFYQAVSRGLVEKTEKGYRYSINPALRKLRRDGDLAYADIVDNTRRVDWSRGWTSVGVYIASMADDYRRAPWRERKTLPVIFLEKDALAGIVKRITDRWQVPLVVARGDASDSLLYEMATTLPEGAAIYTFTDHDYKGRGSIVMALTKLDTDHGVSVQVVRVRLT